MGLQARSDPTLRYARELIQEGYVGEVLSARLSAVGQAVTRRGAGRIWQADRRNGANTLTIAGGHAIDALCFVVGELEEVSARLATRITEWHNTDTGETVAVDSPDWVSVSARLAGGAEVSVLVATVPSSPSGNRIEIYGREGTLVIAGGSANTGPNRLSGARGGEPLAALEPPARLHPGPGGDARGPAAERGPGLRPPRPRHRRAGSASSPTSPTPCAATPCCRRSSARPRRGAPSASRLTRQRGSAGSAGATLI